MEEKKNHSRKRAAAILIAVIAVVVAALLIHQFLLKNDESDMGSGAGEVVAWDVDIDTEEDTAGATGAIQIPGYESMVFTAGETIQTVDIGNPADNTCYFVITLLLEDGTELFQSDYLEPGQGFESMELTQALEEGEYTAVIRYECYSMEDMSALNGASSEFTLIVK